MRVAVVQRICAPYRVPVFRCLARREGIELVIFHGRGTAEGQWQNSKDLEDLEAVSLRTLGGGIRLGARDYHAVLHPGLVRRLSRGGFDVVLAEGATNILNNVPLALWCRARRMPLVFWDSGRFEDQPMNLMRRMAEPIHRRLLRTAAACAGYGQSSADYFGRIGVSRGRVFLARNTLDLDAIQRDFQKWDRREPERRALQRELGLEGRAIVLHVGSLHSSKPLDNLIRVCRAIDRTERPLGLLIIGDGPARARLERLAGSEGYGAVRFVGRVTEDLGRYALISDAAALPERATLAALTLLGYGLPVIAGRNRSPEQEAIHEGVNGFLVSPGDPSCLKETLRKVLLDRPRLAPAHIIREMVTREYAMDRMVDGLEEALRFATRDRSTTGSE